MKITPKFKFAEGSFDTKEVKMLCVPSDIVREDLPANCVGRDYNMFDN